MTLQTTPIVVADGYEDGDANPLRDLPFVGPRNTLLATFRLRPPLDGDGFQFGFMWTQLSSLWLIREVLTRSGEVVTLGVVLSSSGVDLLRPIPSPLKPAGQLWYAFDDGLSGPPGRYDWRGTARLYYRPASLVGLLDGSARALL